MSETPDTAQSTRNIRLGLLIGLVIVAQVVIFIIIFTRNGLPKDPKVWKELQARDAAQQQRKDAHE